MKKFDRKLILEDGSEYYGYGFGGSHDRVAELVFNTSMVGYQEILSDPSYAWQAVVMTYPLIGNYGIADDDFETANPALGAFIIGELNQEPSNFRGTRTLDQVMKQYGIPGISGIDTRKLTRFIRDHGTSRVLLCDAEKPLQEGLDILKQEQIPANVVEEVCCKHQMNGEEFLNYGKNSFYDRAPKRNPGKYHVIAIDCGMKQNIVRSLYKRGCSITVVPYDTSFDVIESLQPDGIFISNGPGNPEDVPELIQTIRKLRGKHPMFGICLGHQLICLSYGASCYKLKFGHRGGNHPVKNMETGKIEITSQNHSYAVKPESLKHTPLKITHVNLLDQTIEGVRYEKDQVFSVQYHPESAPGPEDSSYLFDQFVKMMEENKYAEADRY